MVRSPSGEAVIADDPIGFVDDNNRGRALFLIGKSSRLEPSIESWFAAGELSEIVGRRQQLGAGDRQALVSSL